MLQQAYKQTKYLHSLKSTTWHLSDNIQDNFRWSTKSHFWLQWPLTFAILHAACTLKQLVRHTKDVQYDIQTIGRSHAGRSMTGDARFSFMNCDDRASVKERRINPHSRYTVFSKAKSTLFRGSLETIENKLCFRLWFYGGQGHVWRCWTAGTILRFQCFLHFCAFYANITFAFIYSPREGKTF